MKDNTKPKTAMAIIMPERKREVGEMH